MPDGAGERDDTTPKKGGFGAFSQQYRDRWSTNHPKPSSATDSPPPAIPGAPTPDDASADGRPSNDGAPDSAASA